MEYTLMFSDRKRYNKALERIYKNPKFTAIAGGRDYSHNLFRPWQTMFYVTFKTNY